MFVFLVVAKLARRGSLGNMAGERVKGRYRSQALAKPTRLAKQRNRGYGIYVAVVYPGSRAEGMASLALHALVRLIDAHPHAYCEPIFALELENGKPGSAGIRGSAPAFDLLAFTVSFEEQWLWIPKVLRRFGIPTRSTKRHDAHPILVVGGLAARLNPSPIWLFADLVVPGEAEPIIPKMLDVLEQGRGCSRKELLSELGALPGIAYPAGGSTRVQAVLDESRTPIAQVVQDPESIFRGMFLVETGRGCPVGCRFCAVSFIRRPPVFFSPGQVIDAARQGLEQGLRIGLVGASLSRHPQLTELVDAMHEVGADVSPASLHAGVLAGDFGQHLLSRIAGGGQRSLTLAPETGSERLRAMINKLLAEEELELAVRRLGQAGILHLKLYFMYGLPTEQKEDLQATVELVAKVHRWFVASQRSRGRVGRLSVSLNPLVPKPHTPFAREAMPGLRELRKKRAFLIDGIRVIGGVRVSGIPPRRAVVQCLLGRGGEELAELLELDYQSWPPPEALLRRLLPDYPEKVHQNWHAVDRAPWERVKLDLSPELLRRERDRAMQGVATQACDSSPCSTCGGCTGLTSVLKP